MAAVIKMSNVSKSFGEIRALDNVSLTVREGEFLSLVGPSGCGKTTLLRIAAGLEEPTSGEVRVNGDSPRLACQKHQVGVAFQKPALVPSKSALANVRMTLEITGSGNGMLPEKILNDFGLDEESLTKYPHQLSGGMQQRVDLACAIVHNPTVLLLDEPFGSLDEMTRESMGEWLGQVLRGSSKTVLFVTHNIEEAVMLSDRVVVLSCQPGRVLGVLDIDLPRPRTRESRTRERFLKIVVAVRQTLYSGQ